ncbi:hypothetical protein BJY52DRAFT_1305049 [Lactarius psammicola]|nr:hypothetical protein BJY52DRAFT_1305049 [Lactarius psammicola]
MGYKGENTAAVENENDRSLCAFETDVVTLSNQRNLRPHRFQSRHHRDCLVSAIGESEDVEHPRKPSAPPRKTLDQQRLLVQTDYARNVCAGCAGLAVNKPGRIASMIQRSNWVPATYCIPRLSLRVHASRHAGFLACRLGISEERGERVRMCSQDCVELGERVKVGKKVNGSDRTVVTTSSTAGCATCYADPASRLARARGCRPCLASPLWKRRRKCALGKAPFSEGTISRTFGHFPASARESCGRCSPSFVLARSRSAFKFVKTRVLDSGLYGCRCNDRGFLENRQVQ